MLAVVLACPRDGATTEPAIDMRLAGLPLLLRAVLSLQQQGATAVVVVAREQASVAAQLLDPRITIDTSVCFVTAEQCLWTELSRAVKQQFLLTSYDEIVDPAFYRRLREAEQVKAFALGGAWQRRGRELGEQVSGPGPLRAEPELLPRLAQGSTTWEDLAHGSVVRRLPVGHSWLESAADPVGRRRAVSRLFNACRKPVDGLVSRHLNRHVSLFVSRLLVDTPVTPNQMTAITFSLSLAAAWFAYHGGYANTLAAAALMQLNSILDGCDGELARVRFQGSKLGQWLDTVGDDVSNVIFWTALGFGALQLQPYGLWLAWGGWIAAAGNGLAALQNYYLLWRKGSGDYYALQEPAGEPKRGAVAAVVGFFEIILKQDFFLFLVLCLAVVGVLPYTLPIMAVGAIITLGSSSLRLLKQLRQSRARAGGNV